MYLCAIVRMSVVHIWLDLFDKVSSASSWYLVIADCFVLVSMSERRWHGPGTLSMQNR